MLTTINVFFDQRAHSNRGGRATMNKAIWIYLLSFCFCAEAVGDVTAIRAGAIVDPDSATILTNQTIVVEDGKISAIGGNVKVPQPA